MPDQELMSRIVEVVRSQGVLTRSQIISSLPGGTTIPRFAAAVRELIAQDRLATIGRTKGTRYGLPGMRWEWASGTDQDGVQTGGWVEDAQ